jgi:hypothetical protein
MPHTQVSVQRKVPNGAYRSWVSLFIRMLHASQGVSQGLVLCMHTGPRALLLLSLKRTSDTVTYTPSSTHIALALIPVLAEPAMHASCGLIICPPGSLRSDAGRLRLEEVATLPWTGWQASRGLSGRNPWDTHLCDGATPSAQLHKPSQADRRVPRNA